MNRTYKSAAAGSPITDLPPKAQAIIRAAQRILKAGRLCQAVVRDDRCGSRCVYIGHPLLLRKQGWPGGGARRRHRLTMPACRSTSGHVARRMPNCGSGRPSWKAAGPPLRGLPDHVGDAATHSSLQTAERTRGAPLRAVPGASRRYFRVGTTPRAGKQFAPTVACFSRYWTASPSRRRWTRTLTWKPFSRCRRNVGLDDAYHGASHRRW